MKASDHEKVGELLDGLTNERARFQSIVKAARIEVAVREHHAGPTSPVLTLELENDHDFEEIKTLLLTAKKADIDAIINELVALGVTDIPKS